MARRKAALYARYSSELQNNKSIDDQIALCRAHAERIGAVVVAEFSDRAKSGSSIINREGVLDLIHAAKAGQFEVVIVEALDRLSRDQEDLAGLYKRLTFAGVTIEAVNDGKADQVQIGVRGMLGALYLTDLANKTRRGMQGVIREGRSAGGLSYGYSTVKGEPGVRIINEAEAEVVRRIFSEYRLGKCPRYIARDLNRDGVKPPRRGSAWNASTINGNTKRGIGILQNPLYIGRIVWNRAPMFKDPDTGKRVSRPNPPEKWLWSERPDLAIVDMETWEAVRARKKEQARSWDANEHRSRRDHLFSGIIKCGHCGSGMSLDGLRRGHRVIRCSRSRESHSCDNARRFRLDKIEAAVLDGILANVLDRDHAEIFVREYLAEWRRLKAEMERTVADAEKELAENGAAQARLVAAVAKGLMPERLIAEETTALMARQQELEHRIAMARASLPDGMELSAGAFDHYRQVVDRLRNEAREALSVDQGTKAAFRDLCREIAVSGGSAPRVRVAGDLAALAGKAKPPEGGLAVVAGKGFFTPPPIMHFEVALA